MEQKRRAPRNRTLTLDDAERQMFTERLVRLDAPTTAAGIMGRTVCQDLILDADAFAYGQAVSLNDGDKTTDADLAMLSKLPRLPGNFRILSSAACFRIGDRRAGKTTCGQNHGSRAIQLARSGELGQFAQHALADGSPIVSSHRDFSQRFPVFAVETQSFQCARANVPN